MPPSGFGGYTIFGYSDKTKGFDINRLYVQYTDNLADNLSNNGNAYTCIHKFLNSSQDFDFYFIVSLLMKKMV